MYDLSCLWSAKFYKIYAFTDLHVASGDTSVSAPPLSVCGDTRRRKDFSPFFSRNFPPGSSTFFPRPFQLGWHCVRVCVASVCWSGGLLERGSRQWSGRSASPCHTTRPSPPHTHTQPGQKPKKLATRATRGPNFGSTRWVKPRPRRPCQNLDPALAYCLDWGGFCWSAPLGEVGLAGEVAGRHDTLCLSRPSARGATAVLVSRTFNFTSLAASDPCFIPDSASSSRGECQIFPPVDPLMSRLCSRPRISECRFPTSPAFPSFPCNWCVSQWEIKRR